jgi:hypothetical protein
MAGLGYVPPKSPLAATVPLVSLFHATALISALPTAPAAITGSG